MEVIYTDDGLKIAELFGASLDHFGSLVDSEGAMKSTITALQNLLKRLGFDPGTVDGIPGGKTMTALQAAFVTYRLPGNTGGVTLLSSLKSLGGLTAQLWLVQNATKIADAIQYYNEVYKPAHSGKTTIGAMATEMDLPESGPMVGEIKADPFTAATSALKNVYHSKWFWPGVIGGIGLLGLLLWKRGAFKGLSGLGAARWVSARHLPTRGGGSGPRGTGRASPRQKNMQNRMKSCAKLAKKKGIKGGKRRQVFMSRCLKGRTPK